MGVSFNNLLYYPKFGVNILQIPHLRCKSIHYESISTNHDDHLWALLVQTILILFKITQEICETNNHYHLIYVLKIYFHKVTYFIMVLYRVK